MVYGAEKLNVQLNGFVGALRAYIFHSSLFESLSKVIL